MSTAQPDLHDAIQRQTELVLDALAPEQLGEQMAEELMSSMPEFGGPVDADLRIGLVRSCASNVREVFRVLASGADTDSISPPADATAWAGRGGSRAARGPGRALERPRARTCGSRRAAGGCVRSSTVSSRA